jgi:maleamate amidohydrolase
MSSEAIESLDANYGDTGFNGRIGFGTKPALVLIDLVEAYFREGSPLYHPRFRESLEASLRLREEAHRASVPVILTRVEYKRGGIDGGAFFKKIRIALMCFEEDNPLGDFPPSLKVRPEDIILTKKYASSFFCTPLAPMLTSHGVDTVILTGVSTSGCVRATAVDSCSSGFRTMVVREAVGDRHSSPHEANLFDINAKYGDVVSEAETTNYLRSLGQRPQ